MLALRNLIILTVAMMILIGCGQQTMKDEGLDTKNIEDAGSTSGFKVISVDPTNGATSVDKNINISFTFNKSLSKIGAGISGNCNDQLFYLSTDSSFGSCVSYQNNCSYSSIFYLMSNNDKTVQLCMNALSSNTTYYIKYVKLGSLTDS